jgi:ribosomal protein L7/L12
MLIIKMLEQCSEEEKGEAYLWLFAYLNTNNTRKLWSEKEAKRLYITDSGPTYDLTLTEIDPRRSKKIGAIKVVREVLGLPLKEAKDQVEAGIIKVPYWLSVQGLESFKYSLSDCGYKLD